MTIVGIGLIGGSLAGALRCRGLARRVIGVGRNRSRVEAAREAGLLDEATDDLHAAAARSSLIVFCTPVGEIVRQVREVLPHLRSDALVTDAGSVKRAICEPLADEPRFLGSHPIAGKEVAGWEHADAELFEGRTCVITPGAQHTAAHIERITKFWQGVSMDVRRMSAAEHDAALARTSHVPHLVAAAVAAALPADLRTLVGTGFKSTTRIASGPPELWTDILTHNRSEVLAGIAEVEDSLHRFREALTQNDAVALQSLLAAAKRGRDVIGH